MAMDSSMREEQNMVTASTHPMNSEEENPILEFEVDIDEDNIVRKMNGWQYFLHCNHVWF